MGLTFIDVEVGSTTGPLRPVSFLVDSGATFSVLPYDVWREMGLEPQRSVTVELADGSRYSRASSECRFSLKGVTAHSPVILGEPGDDALLGALSLETLGLVLDPLRRELRPMRARMQRDAFYSASTPSSALSRSLMV